MPYYPPSGGSGSSNSAGLMGTGNSLVTWQSDQLLTNQRILTAGSSITIRSDNSSIYIDALTGGGVASTTKDYYYYQPTELMNSALLNGNRYRIAGLLGAVALASDIADVNSMNCVPLVVTKSVVVDTMACRVTIAGSATTQIQLGIYTNSSDTILFPFEAVSTSLHLTGTNATAVAFNPAVTLSANTLYWAVYLVIRSSVTIRANALSSTHPIFGGDSVFGSAIGTSIKIFCSTTLPSIMPGSGNISSDTPPSLFFRNSM